MPYLVQGTDTSGNVSLRRDSAAAAAKKASELIADGCWDVQITAPDGHVYPEAEFNKLETSA